MSTSTEAYPGDIGEPTEGFSDWLADPDMEIWLDPELISQLDPIPIEHEGRKGLVHETSSLELNINAYKAIKEGRQPANFVELAYMRKLASDPVMRLSIDAVYEQRTEAVEAVDTILTLEARHSTQFMYVPSGDMEAENPYRDGKEDSLKKYHQSKLYEEFARVAKSFDPYYDPTSFVT